MQVLSGPPGTGKTLLLRVLAERLAGDLRPLYVPYGSLAFPELCELVLGLLGEPAGDSPSASCLA